MTTTNPTTTQNRDQLIEMFLDGTPGEAYADGRLLTVRNENYTSRTVDLIAFGKYVVARYDERTNVVRIFNGHYGKWSKTLSRYLTRTRRVAEEHTGRRIIHVDDSRSPVIGGGSAEVASAAKYIDNYVSSYTGMSKVEANAVAEVENALRVLANSLL